METSTRFCLECKKPLKGRIDKKFCNDYCRNAYNNKSKTAENSYVREITLVLKKNRRILEALLGNEDMTKTPKNKFISKGFQFNFHTHQYVNQKGNIYFFCFEYGFLPLPNDLYLVVKKKNINKS
jgi:hypothetical protein